MPLHLTQHPVDKLNGFSWRRVEIERVKKPEHHFITINGVPQPEMKTLRCDICGEPIKDGDPAVAISEWKHGEMAPWEAEYQ
jgi:hypothetical protein